MSVKLSGDLAAAFIAALIDIARSDNLIDLEEGLALRRVIESHVSAEFDFEMALFSKGSVLEFANVLKSYRPSSRGIAVSFDEQEVIDAFIGAVEAISTAAGGKTAKASRLVRIFLIEMGHLQ